MQRFNCSHTYWWLCFCTWFGLSMSMWQAISLTLLTWTTLQCHLSKEMYNDYLQNIIITYFIKCHNISKDWISLYANIIDISIFVIFWYDILCQHEFDGHPVHTVMQTSMWPHCVLTAWGLWTPLEYPLISRCKDTLNTCPTSWFVARYFKESWVPHCFV